LPPGEGSNMAAGDAAGSFFFDTKRLNTVT
jgi:hypothetical protein